MDLTSVLTSLLSGDGVAQISKAAKADKKDVTGVLTAALPLLAGNAANVSQSSLIDQLKKGAIAKLIQTLFGKKAEETISAASGVSQQTTGSILNTAAPLIAGLATGNSSPQPASQGLNLSSVTSLLGGLVSTNTAEEEPAETSSSQTSSGGGLFSALGSLLGGGMEEAPAEEPKPAASTGKKKKKPASSSAKKPTSSSAKKKESK